MVKRDKKKKGVYQPIRKERLLNVEDKKSPSLPTWSSGEWYF